MTAPALSVPAGVQWVERAVEGAPDASSRQQVEHDAGRAAARDALRAFGVRDGRVQSTEDGVPLFPEPFIGSISHDDGLAVSAVADRRAGWAGIGIDLHRPRDLTDREAAYLADAEEIATACSLVGPAAAPHVLFSLKEAVFKAVWAAQHRWLEFADIRVHLDGAPTAELVSPHLPGAVLRWDVAADRIRALVLLR